MHLLGQRTLGIAVLMLLGLLVAVKRFATGSIVEYKPEEDRWAWLTNLFNLFFLLIVNPVAGILLVGGRFEAIDRTHLLIQMPLLLTAVEIAGLVLYGTGFLLMAWALLSLKNNYQLGGSAPRLADEMITVGPYRLVRHPMYTAALSISLGLPFLVQSCPHRARLLRLD